LELFNFAFATGCLLFHAWNKRSIEWCDEALHVEKCAAILMCCVRLICAVWRVCEGSDTRLWCVMCDTWDAPSKIKTVFSWTMKEKIKEAGHWSSVIFTERCTRPHITIFTNHNTNKKIHSAQHPPHSPCPIVKTVIDTFPRFLSREIIVEILGQWVCMCVCWGKGVWSFQDKTDWKVILFILQQQNQPSLINT
jgi:hypothetical protein